jgi:hypothetical protein
MSISYAINRQAHAAGLRAELELMRRRGPQLPDLAYSIERGRIVTRHRGVTID